MNSAIETFYSDLRRLKEGKLSIFFGAGSSYDYGIPTMEEMAKMLIEELKNGTSKIFDKDACTVLNSIIGLSTKDSTGESKKQKNSSQWNIEDLLTRLHRIQEAIGDEGSPFPKVNATIGSSDFSKDEIKHAESKLVEFMVKCYQLDIIDKTSHGVKSIEYLSNFFECLGGFYNSISVFTTNNDLCIETALLQLSQRPKNTQKKTFYLIDGFSHGALPIFSMINFSIVPPVQSNRVVVYLWKLHGSIDWTYTCPLTDTEDEKTQNTKFHDDSIICRYIDPDMWKKFQKAGAISKASSLDQSKIMIFPTPSKYSQTYNNPYMDLYQAFRRTLETSELLLAVGTSFPDSHINSAVKSFINRDNTQLYVVDPEVTCESIHKLFGKCNSIQPIIKLGFKDFIQEVRNIELMREKESPKEGRDTNE
ncbi:MAG: hypothetical protein A2Y00_05610 [Omnitrophica WOR_2 bacterium GWF2_43_52]|nr:MAG: hypothetical protein A2Y06_02575 [Omnitrophica WOR_2 bacterium GWA2_37_7]OGX16397.1 MAG: hypothetical protein A2Y01_07475 [Omnitrophica WOR_2 bacterium GWC2_44_8]OGX20577.1 MAG: hypothetical protein A2Y00_05610 [Omnitrophica WOR_2 bacterium GWF2_43_52]OGX58906.1 MAG: hypothetical protein A2460_03565 [Omnitrophica WOR_2 bacterium RIFOXYC2_FULL_43_9]HAH21605.1 hypothetical protein [Candidatus Omnitrophota bacterium]